MLLTHLHILISPVVKELLSFVLRASVLLIGIHIEASLTKLIGFLLYFNLHVSLEYTGRSALIHIYGSLFCADAPFLVSVGSWCSSYS
jgi:hypothetical protein